MREVPPASDDTRQEKSLFYSSKGSDARGLRVFHVDDSPEFSDGFAELLRSSGRCGIVGHAASEKIALQWSFANEAGFDVAVVDLVLKQGSGFPVIVHLCKYQPGRVVVLSDYASPSISERCKKLGVAAAFTKIQALECVQYIVGLARA